jgi:hypothetical protein
MQFTRYIIQFTDSGCYHCVGSPKDPADISNAHLMNEVSLKTAIAKNCHIWVGKTDGGSEKVQIPYRVIEVVCSLA